MSEKRRIVVTSALPYANGDIHLGHLVEYIQTDFWVRFQKMRGNDCVYVCADDTHGTPIMIRAAKEGITPEELIARSHAAHQRLGSSLLLLLRLQLGQIQRDSREALAVHPGDHVLLGRNAGDAIQIDGRSQHLAVVMIGVVAGDFGAAGGADQIEGKLIVME